MHRCGEVATPVADQTELVFSQTVEGLLRALGPLDAATKGRMQALGVDPDRLEPAYPADQYVALQRLAVELFAPNQPFPVGIEALGRRFVDGYGETLMGRAVLAGLRLLGPVRALERLSRTLSTGSTFFKTKLEEVRPAVWRLWINRVTYPGWYVGLVQRGLEHAGAKKVEVRVVEHVGPGQGLTLEVTWAARG